jgi:DNA-binding response OmpR family regulator
LAKVLLIEDEANVRTLTEMQLKHLGYEVLLADNGWKGLALYRQSHPDVIVLDLTLPGMNGLEVLKQIRSVDQRQLVIVVTGDDTPKTEREVRALGVREFIVKGASVYSLGDALKRLLKDFAPLIYPRAS